MPAVKRELDEYEVRVLRTIEPEYEYLVLVVPGRAGVNDFAAGAALAELKKRKLVAFEGRGNMKSVYLTPEGEAAWKELPAA
jgi:hypothetical protein